MDNVTEQELIASSKAKGSERVTLSDVEGAIVGEYYFTAAEATKGAPQARELSLLSFCVLVLWNGFTVTGQSACADPKSFDPEIGKRLARAHAVNQIWPLMGYELKSRMARDHQRAHRPVRQAERSEAATAEAAGKASVRR